MKKVPRHDYYVTARALLNHGACTAGTLKFLSLFFPGVNMDWTRPGQGPRWKQIPITLLTKKVFLTPEMVKKIVEAALPIWLLLKYADDTHGTDTYNKYYQELDKRDWTEKDDEITATIIALKDAGYLQ